MSDAACAPSAETAARHFYRGQWRPGCGTPHIAYARMVVQHARRMGAGEAAQEAGWLCLCPGHRYLDAAEMAARFGGRVAELAYASAMPAEGPRGSRVEAWLADLRASQDAELCVLVLARAAADLAAWEQATRTAPAPRLLWRSWNVRARRDGRARWARELRQILDACEQAPGSALLADYINELRRQLHTLENL